MKVSRSGVLAGWIVSLGEGDWVPVLMSDGLQHEKDSQARCYRFSREIDTSLCPWVIKRYHLKTDLRPPHVASSSYPPYPISPLLPSGKHSKRLFSTTLLPTHPLVVLSSSSFRTLGQQAEQRRVGWIGWMTQSGM